MSDFNIIDSNIKEISERFDNRPLTEILSISRVLKGSENDLQEIESSGYYNGMIHFKELKKEVISWKFSLRALPAKLII